MVAAPPAGSARLRLLVAYDGEPFHGFARNPGVKTVAGDLSAALAVVLRQPVELTCAGRTDAGVHAWGQVVSCDAPTGLDLDRVQRSVNAILAPAIVIRSAVYGADDFDARFSALSRTYRYTVLPGLTPDPFWHRFSWHVSRPLDVAAMDQAAGALVGSHDFTSFCRGRRVLTPAGPVEASLVRTVARAGWTVRGRFLRFEIEAGAFCHQMVRSITGTLVEVGYGKRRPESLLVALAARNRAAAGDLAPPKGLCLWSVSY